MKYFYNDLVLKHFFKPSHVGVLNLAEPGIATAQVGSVAAGEWIYFQLAIEQMTIKSAKFKAYGNAFIIAGMDYIAEYSEGKSVAVLQAVNHADLMKLLNIPSIKRHSALLMEDVVGRTIEAYHQLFIYDLEEK